MAVIGGWFSERFRGRFGLCILGMMLGTVAAYAFGTGWLAFQAHLTFEKALMAGVIPYIPGDLIKIYAGVFVGGEVRKRLGKERL